MTRPVVPPETEAHFQKVVVDIAESFGWLVYHTHDSRRSQAGFPDLIMLRGARQVVAELKAMGKYPTAIQRVWLAAFKNAGAETYVWRPSDKQAIVNILL